MLCVVLGLLGVMMLSLQLTETHSGNPVDVHISPAHKKVSDSRKFRLSLFELSTEISYYFGVIVNLTVAFHSVAVNAIEGVKLE